MMDENLWKKYLRLLEELTKTIHQLTEIERTKTVAVTQGRVDEVEECMKREQALSLSVRGFEQRRGTMLAQMGLQNVPLRQLEAHAPEDLLMETKRVAEALRGEYEQFKTASKVARNTLECNLRAIERMQAKATGEPPVPTEKQEQPSQYDFRA